ncbi:abhydrolase domain-containing protein 15-like [Stegastes partitus]|uniref:Abhydrolase domain-containing protein 15-like n=1 Tax=Stegastes partitus TaxID=144197 RepID=A0A9Y4N973_9TELE|nr:PREDICTED: abhydrolase domain-containing protein 15-like [Stegastes partitus]
MASFVWDLLFLLPSLLLVLLSVALHRPTVRCWTRSAVQAAAWRFWVTVCLILELPLHKNTRREGAKPIGWDISSGSAQASDGPRLICKHTALARYLLRHCGPLARSRLASWPRGDPHLQTMSSLLWGQQGDTLQFTRDHLLLRDGGIVALDWAVGTRLGEARRRWEGRKEQQSGGKSLGCFTPTPPVLLLIPQAWGGLTPHMKALCHQAMQQGFYVVVFHPRGTSSCPLTTARLTEFGDPADLEQAISYVHSRHPSSLLVAVSEGSGSGILLSYLGECGSSTHLTAAAAISPVLQGQLWFETVMPPVYRWGALFHRKLQLSRYTSSFRGVLDVDRALSCSSLKDFEETLFCPSVQLQPKSNSGLSSGSDSPQGLAPSVVWALGERAYPAKDWESYWERNEPLRDADEVAVPVLCICSSDDPLLPPTSTLPLPLFLSNPYFLLVLTDRGGHCGFTLEQTEEEKRTGGEQVEEGVWSHITVLEYFRVVADFLKGEQRDGGSWSVPLDENSTTGQRSWIRNVAPPRRRRAAMTRRPRPQNAEQMYEEADEGEFTWKRSYTR